jgi:hypothetical protein
MSNKRIDLTQFERILNGPWSLVDGNEVLVCPTEECLGWCECGKGVPTKGRWRWQYIIGADIDTGRDLVMAAVEQTIDEVMGWDNDGNYNIPPKEEGIAYATAKAVQMLPNLITELKRCYEELDRPKVTIDDWDKEGPCVTVYLEGKEYVGILREYDASE